jgi:hypothetical protein
MKIGPNFWIIKAESRLTLVFTSTSTVYGETSKIPHTGRLRAIKACIDLWRFLNYIQKFSSIRAYLLSVPEPTIATHIQGGCLSPKIDWKRYLIANKLERGEIASAIKSTKSKYRT